MIRKDKLNNDNIIDTSDGLVESSDFISTLEALCLLELSSAEQGVSSVEIKETAKKNQTNE